MKKTLTITFLLGSLAIIAASFGLGHALTLFLFIGLIPGTNIIITPEQMLLLVGVISGFALARLTIPAARRFLRLA